MKDHRTGFRAALGANLAVAGLVAGLCWRLAPAVSAADPSGPPPTAAEPPEPPLAPLQISPQRLQSIGVTFGEVGRKVLTDDIRTTGSIAIDETRVSYVQVRFSGTIRKVFVDSTYRRVRKGEPLFTIYSPDLVATEREYLLARRNEREVAQSKVPGVAAAAAELVDAAAERLAEWDVPPGEIARLEATGVAGQEVEVDSPASGYVVAREAFPDKYVQPDTRLYTVADLSTVWAFAQVFQIDLGRIKAGDPAALTVDTYPGRTFSGRVDFVYPDVDLATRTARVRVVVPNPGLRLMPGMFVDVGLKIPMGRRVVIPAAGVLQSGTRQIAFIDLGGGALQPRAVELGAQVGDDFIVLKGLKPGERIVTSANFLIDSESQLQAAFGTFAPPAEAAGGSAAPEAPQAAIELTTDPNPPSKGADTVRVRLTGADGTPVVGADVSVTLYMAAMPAMGMAAMRVPIELADRGAGVYEGSGILGSGGTWQVTIVAAKGGRTLARKELSINAEGGM
jgi:membrane fusion protein, copper/silver efflux system